MGLWESRDSALLRSTPFVCRFRKRDQKGALLPAAPPFDLFYVCRRILPAKLPDHPAIHIHRSLQLLNLDPLALGVGLGDVAGAKDHGLATLLVEYGFGSVGHGVMPNVSTP